MRRDIIIRRLIMTVTVKFDKKNNVCKGIHLDDLIEEKKHLEREIMETVDEELKGLLGRRLERINQEIDKRDPDEENHLKKFIGIFSYFVGVSYIKEN